MKQGSQPYCCISTPRIAEVLSVFCKLHLDGELEESHDGKRFLCTRYPRPIWSLARHRQPFPHLGGISRSPLDTLQITYVNSRLSELVSESTYLPESILSPDNRPLHRSRVAYRQVL